MLKVNDKIFIAGYGAGYVQDMDSKELFGEMCKYVNIYLLLDNMNFMIPIKRLESYKTRKILDKVELEKIFNDITVKEDQIEDNWNKRYRINKRRIQSGDTFKMCQVIKDLHRLKNENILPPGELKVLERVEGIVASEIMIVAGLSMEESLAKIWRLI